MRVKNITISKISVLTGLDIDEVLLQMWEYKLDYYHSPKSKIKSRDLELVKRIFNINSLSSLYKLKYWKTKLNLSEEDFNTLLKSLGISHNDTIIKNENDVEKILSYSKHVSEVSEITQKEQNNKTIHEDYAPLEKWETIGHLSEKIERITIDDAIHIHNELVLDFINHDDPIEPSGIKNRNLLESAITRQFTSLGDDLKYPTVEMTGAALIHSLIHNHPFHNGNKRTALVSFLVFLDKNKYILTCEETELFQFIMKVSAHKLVSLYYPDSSDREVLFIARWVKSNTRRLEFGDRPLKFQKLNQILNRYDCKKEINGNTVKFVRVGLKKSIFGRRKNLSTSFVYGGEGREIPHTLIRTIRIDLELTEENGIDSAAFYDDETTSVDSFILKYRKILSRLSKL